MKRSVLLQPNVIKWLVVSIIIACSQIQSVAESDQPCTPAIEFTVKTCDGLELPAQVRKPSISAGKLLLFISGSTPYDHKGNQWAGWDASGNIIPEKQDFYSRFMDVMSSKGYRVATMAKRSFVDSQRIPRPNLSDLALDVRSLILELKSRELLRTADDLVIVGYSEGSIVATKVLALLKEQPAACILLGSGSSAYNFKTQSWQDWHQTDLLRRIKGWSDEQIQTEFEQMGKIMTALLEIDEESFEGEYKKSSPYGFGFAPWESFYIDRECQFYDPVPNLLTANIPLLICIGQNDGAMPMVLAERTYKDLLEQGFNKATFKVIEGEVHQYKQYDVFAIIDAWIDSGYCSTEFVLDEQDKQIIANREASVDQIARAIDELPWQGGAPEKALECFRKAKDADYQEQDPWFKLGLVLFDSAHYEESMYSFKKTTDPDFILCFASMAWIGHINDLLNNRQEAISWYKKALARYQGPVQHDQWGIIIDKKWIEERLASPFTGIK